jgi:hypothetical protein
MSIVRVPPFDAPVRLAGRRVDDPDGVSLKRLRDAVAGKDVGWPRAHAMTRLLESDFPNKHRDFERVLANEADAPEARYLAALHLGMVDTRAALDALIAQTTIRDERVLTGVLKALGRIGDASALAAIERVQKSAPGGAAAQAAFAAALIAHRLDLPGHSLPVPSPSDYDADVSAPVDAPADALRRPDCGRLRVTGAGAADAELCLRSLSRRPLGVELLESPMYEVRCGRAIWMIALERAAGGPHAIDRLTARKTLQAVVARRDRDTGLYAAAFLVLTAPDAAGGGAHVLVHRVDGGLISAGHARVDDGGAAFALWPVKGPRPYSIAIEGRLEAGRLVITAAVAGRGEKRSVARERLPVHVIHPAYSRAPG